MYVANRFREYDDEKQAIIEDKDALKIIIRKLWIQKFG